MSDDLVRLEGKVDRLTDGLNRLIDLVQEQGRTLTRLVGEVGEIRGRMQDMPTARDFGRLEGRVILMSERLTTVIGYNPEPRRAAGG